MENLPCPPAEIDSFIATPRGYTIGALANVKGDVMVLGAGGKMGLHLSLALQEGFRHLGRDNHVIAVSRFQSLRPRVDFEKFHIETHRCDVSVAEELEGLPDCPNVFYLAGIKFGTASAPQILYRMNVHAPSLVAKKFRRSRLVVFSTGCVYPFVPIDSGGSREEDQTEPVGAYARSCVGREEAFIRSSRELGTRCTIVRLNYSVEFRYGVFVDIAEKVYRGEPIDVTTGHFNAIWQGDAIAYIIQSLACAASPPFILNVAGAQILSVRQVAQRFGEIFVKEPIIAGQEEETDWLNNAEKARSMFNGRDVSADKIIEWTAAWLQAGGETWGKPTLFEQRGGKF